MKIIRFDLKGPDGNGIPAAEPHPSEIIDGKVPTQYRHLYFQDAARGLKVGIWGCTPFATKLVRQRSHEFVVVAHGALEIVDREGKAHRFSKNECFVLPAGIERRWVHHHDATVFFVSLENRVPAPDVVEPIRIDPSGSELASSPPPASEMLLSPAPITRISVSYQDPTATWTTGVWDATPYHRKIVPFPRYELMHLVEGEVSFTSEDGQTKAFAKGDTLMVPPGVVADWKNSVYIRKIYCVFPSETSPSVSNSRDRTMARTS